jgi:hypothetical protein
VPEVTCLSICRDVSASADVLGANREAFVITAVTTPNNSGWQRVKSGHPEGLL